MFRRIVALAIVSLAGWGASNGVAYGQAIETPPAFDTRQLLGARIKGANYTIAPTTQSDGYLYIYNLTVNKKQFRVEGNELLATRLYELNVLQQLRSTTQGGELVKGVGKAVVQPIEFAGRVVTNPAGTVVETISGVGAFFGRAFSGISNAGTSPEGPVQSVLGISDAKRALALKYGVDPYTDFEPLAIRLSDLSTASAFGKLTVAGALTVASGGAALAISGVSTAGNIHALIYQKTASQIRDINREKLKKIGVGDKVIKRLLDNKNYTVTDRAIMIGAIENLQGVANRHVFIGRAAEAGNRGFAFFQRRRAEHLENYHRSRERLREFVSVAGFPLNKTRSGKILALFPIDSLSWTKTNARIFTSVTEDIRRKKLAKILELRTTGWTTVLAENRLKRLGWRVARIANR